MIVRSVHGVETKVHASSMGPAVNIRWCLFSLSSFPLAASGEKIETALAYDGFSFQSQADLNVAT